MKTRLLLILTIFMFTLVVLPQSRSPSERSQSKSGRATNKQFNETSCDLSNQASADWCAKLEENIRRSAYLITWQDKTCLPDLNSAYQALNPAQNLRAYLTNKGIRIIPCNEKTPNWELGLILTGYGYEGDIKPVTISGLTAVDNRLEYRRNMLTEWYVNEEQGIEQGFTLTAPPKSKNAHEEEQVVLEMAFSGDLTPKLNAAESALEFFTSDGRSVVSYGSLFAYDATGRNLPAQFVLRDKQIAILVTAKDAVYPVSVDPSFSSAGKIFGDDSRDDPICFSNAIQHYAKAVAKFDLGLGNMATAFLISPENHVLTVAHAIPERYFFGTLTFNLQAETCGGGLTTSVQVPLEWGDMVKDADGNPVINRDLDYALFKIPDGRDPAIEEGCGWLNLDPDTQLTQLEDENKGLYVIAYNADHNKVMVALDQDCKIKEAKETCEQIEGLGYDPPDDACLTHQCDIVKSNSGAPTIRYNRYSSNMGVVSIVSGAEGGIDIGLDNLDVKIRRIYQEIREFLPDMGDNDRDGIPNCRDSCPEIPNAGRCAQGRSPSTICISDCDCDTSFGAGDGRCEGFNDPQFCATLPADGFESNDLPEQAAELLQGRYDLTIHDLYDTDFFRITIPDDTDFIQIIAREEAGYLNKVLAKNITYRLCDSSGNCLDVWAEGDLSATNTGWTYSESGDIPAGREYLLEIYNWNLNGPIKYTLDVYTGGGDLLPPDDYEDNNNSISATDWFPGCRFNELTIHDDSDIDWYQLDGSGYSVKAKISFDPNRGDLQLFLDNILATESTLSSDGTQKTLTITGCGLETSRVRVRGDANYYNLCITKIPLQESCQGDYVTWVPLIGSGTFTYTGQICQPGEQPEEYTSVVRETMYGRITSESPDSVLWSIACWLDRPDGGYFPLVMELQCQRAPEPTPTEVTAKIFNPITLDQIIWLGITQGESFGPESPDSITGFTAEVNMTQVYVSPFCIPGSGILTIQGVSDSDSDSISDSIEIDTGTDPNSDDTDSDGLPDGAEDANQNGQVDYLTDETDPREWDSDEDGVSDGVERGLTSPESNDTDTSTFQPDMDPETTTDPTRMDTDRDGMIDGEEDANKNGRVDTGETSPIVPDAEPLSDSELAQSLATVSIDATDSDVGLYTSIALDSNNNPHISYYDATNKDLKYTTKRGSIWSSETVDATGDVGLYTSIVLDVLKNPYISHYDQGNNELKLAYTETPAWPMTWEKKRGPSARLATSNSTSIVLNPVAVNPIIAYFDNDDGELKLAMYDRADILPDNYKDQGWATETITASNTWMEDVSLALDSGSEPHIGYIDLSGLNTDLKYAEKQCLGAGCLTQFTQNQPTGQGTWNFETVDPTGVSGKSASIALDSNNNPHVSYYDATNKILMYATKSGGTWNIETVDAAGDVGLYTSIAVDSNNNPHISYYDATNEDLKYATKNGGTWVIQTVDATGDVGSYTSIAVDSNNNPHISYYDATNGDLKYAFPRVPIDVMMVLDLSGSMLSTACSGCTPKLDVLKDAVELFVQLWTAIAVPEDRMGVTYFRTNISEYDVGGDVLLEFLPHADGIIETVRDQTTAPANLTAMGGGLQSAINTMVDETRLRNIILFTNGMQNVNPMVMGDAAAGLEINNNPSIPRYSNINPKDPPTKLNTDLGIKVNTIGVGATDPFMSLLNLIASDTNSVSKLTTAPDDDLRRFFVEDLTEVLQEYSPQLLAYRYGKLTDKTTRETFTVNNNARKVILKLSWKRGSSLSFRVKKDGVDLTNLGEIINGPFYRIYSVDIPIMRGRTISPGGDWHMQISGKKGSLYEAAAIVEEPLLKYNCTFDKKNYVAGEPIELSVRLLLDGKPVTDTSSVSAQIFKPKMSIGTFLSVNPMPHKPSGFQAEPEATAGQIKLQLLQQNNLLWEDVRPIRKTIELKNNGDGSYSGVFSDTKIPGSYTVLFQVEGEHPDIGLYKREEVLSTIVLFGKAERKRSDLRLSLIEETADGRHMLLSLRPEDQFGNYLGPDYGHRIKMVLPTESVSADKKDLADGSYTIPLFVPHGTDPYMTLTIMDQPVFKGPLSKIELKRLFSLSIHTGTAVPTSSFANDFNPGINALLNAGHQFSPQLSLVGLIGYNNFKSKTTGVDDNYWINLSVNIKYRLHKRALSPYLAGGPGYYIPKIGSNKLGGNLGFGLNYDYNNFITFEIGADYHTIFDNDVQFLHSHAGVIFRF